MLLGALSFSQLSSLALAFLSTQFRMALVAREAGLKSSQQIQGHFSRMGVPMWGSRADQISIETAQSSLDCSILEKLPGKTIMVGVLDLSTPAIETPETVAARIRRALPHLSADRIIVAPDCGLKYLPRTVAFGKMKAMADGAKIVRSELQ